MTAVPANPPAAGRDPGPWSPRRWMLFLGKQAFGVAIVSGGFWVLGAFHQWLYGPESLWMNRVMVDHPLACGLVLSLVANALLSASPQRSRASLPEPIQGGAALPLDPGEACRRAEDMLRGAAPNVAGARVLLEEALLDGSVVARYALGTWYAHGFGVERDEARAIVLLAGAAEAGHPDALHDLASLRERGRGCEADPVSAYRLYLRAALLGHSRAAREVERCLRDGTGVAADPGAAEAWRETAAAAGRHRWGLPAGSWPYAAAPDARGG